MAVLGALLLFASHASAEARLDWQADEGCPDASTVTNAMNAWLLAMGTPLVASELQIDAEVERSDSGYELTLELRTRSGARRMRMFSESCEVFSQVIAMQASLLITDEEPQPPPQAPAAGRAPRTRGDQAKEREIALRAQGLFVSSPLPAPTFGLSIIGAYVVSPWRVELARATCSPASCATRGFQRSAVACNRAS